MNILVTGANGFIGSHLCTRLQAAGWNVRGTVRSLKSTFHFGEGVVPIVVGPLWPDTNWSQALDGIDTVIHLAARVHVMNDQADDPLNEFRRVNALGTEKVAREAAKAGVRRLVYISTIKVNGEEASEPYTTDSPARPSAPYAISKWEAEQSLQRVASETGLEVVVVRPTLVYGPGVKANFLNFMNVIQRGIPLPFASVSNRRSMIYIGNLVDALATCAVHPSASGKTYLVSDGEDISTPELIQRMNQLLGSSTHLFPFPPVLLRLAGSIVNKSAEIDRLLGSLTVDSSKFRNELGWEPPFTLNDGLRETAKWYNSLLCNTDRVTK